MIKATFGMKVGQLQFKKELCIWATPPDRKTFAQFENQASD